MHHFFDVLFGRLSVGDFEYKILTAAFVALLTLSVDSLYKLTY